MTRACSTIYQRAVIPHSQQEHPRLSQDIPLRRTVRAWKAQVRPLAIFPLSCSKFKWQPRHRARPLWLRWSYRQSWSPIRLASPNIFPVSTLHRLASGLSLSSARTHSNLKRYTHLLVIPGMEAHRHRMIPLPWTSRRRSLRKKCSRHYREVAVSSTGWTASLWTMYRQTAQSAESEHQRARVPVST